MSNSNDIPLPDTQFTTTYTLSMPRDPICSYHDMIILKHAWILSLQYTSKLDRAFFLKAHAYDLLDRISDTNPSREDKIMIGSYTFTVTYADCSYQWLESNEQEEVYLSVRILKERGLFILCCHPVRGWDLKYPVNSFVEYVGKYK